MNCQHCQPLLLDHLYGLLDGPEAEGVDAHLAECPACAAARAETARVQGLFAKAAKSAFPGTRFEPPVEAPAKVGATTPAPTTALPVPVVRPAATSKRALRAGAVLAWAVAAAVLLAIPGTVVPVLGAFSRAEGARFQAETAQRNADLLAGDVESARAGIRKRQTDADFKVTAAEQTEIALLNEWVKEQKAAVQKATARRLDINVQKPATLQPGAPNDFIVVVNDRREQWERSNTRMVAEVHAVGASDAVIFTQSLDSERQADKTHTVRLPAAAWTKVKPDAELFLVVAQRDEKTQARTELLEPVKLAGPVFATLLVTDKAQYQPGERLFFRSLTLDRISFRPPAREQVLRYELLKSDGRAYSGLNVSGTTDLVRVGNEGKVEPVRTADGAPVRGVGCGEFVLPPDLPDGDYQLALRELPNPGGFPAAVPGVVTRPVKVRSGEANHFRKMLGFGRATFAPGETVEARAELAFQDKPVPNAEVVAVTAMVDGHPVERVDYARTTDANGRANVRFLLPEQVQRGDVRLKVTFRTPLGTESVARQVPVIGSQLKVEFFPESGDALVAGVECKVYVRATTPAGTPADVRGVITDGRQVLARVETLTDGTEPGANRGLASFTYTPKLGTRVWLKLESPAGISAPILTEVPVPNASVALLGGPAAMALRTGHVLPPAKSEGVVMSVLDPVTAPGEPIRVRLHSVGRARQLVVGAYTRGRLSDTQKVTVASDQPLIVKLMTGTDPRGGVVRVTAFEEIDDKNANDERTELKPVAERLVFRKPGEVLKLACAVGPADGRGAVTFGANVAPAPAPALPMGSQAKLSITATDEKGNPAAAILWAAAVNTGAAPGPKDRLMTTHFFLAGEVKKPDDLEDADFLLTDHPKAAVALDLLLGTQGWRRFAEQHPAPVDVVRAQPAGANLPAPNTELARIHAQNGQYAVPTVPPLLHENRVLAEKFGPLYEAAVRAHAQARAKRDAVRVEVQDTSSVDRATARADAAKREANESAARATAAQGPVRQFRANAWYAVAGLFALAMCCGLFAATRPADRFPLGFSTLGSLGLAAFLLVAASWTDGGRVAAKDVPSAAAPPRAVGTKAEAEHLGFATANEAAESKGFGFDAPEPKADAPAVQVAPKTDAGFGAAKPPAKGGFGALGGGVAAAKSDAVGGGGMGAAGGFGVPGTPVAAPGKPPEPKMAPQPPRPVPVEPPSAPGGAGAGPGAGGPGGLPGPGAAPDPLEKDKGWSPYRAGTVTMADILAGQQTVMGGKRGEARDSARFAERAAADLKKASDQATAYASDRANNLTAAMDAYFRQRGRAPKATAAPLVSADKLREAEQFAVGQILGAVVQPPPLVVREFAAPRPAAPVSADDYADTILWQPVICLPTDGKVTLDFHLGAAPGGYQVLVAGHTTDGRLGAVRGLIRTTPSQTVTPNVPAGSVPPAVPVAPGSPRAP